MIFTLYLLIFRNWKTYTFCSIKSGKVATTLQFILLILLAQGYSFPYYANPLLFVVGLFVLAELFFIHYREAKRRTL